MSFRSLRLLCLARVFDPFKSLQFLVALGTAMCRSDHRHSALAFANVQLAMFGYDPPKVAYPKARTTVMKALELDENLGEAHAVLGHIKLLFDWDWSGAEKEERRALELSPNSADTHDEYGF